MPLAVHGNNYAISGGTPGAIFITWIHLTVTTAAYDVYYISIGVE